MDYDRWLEKPYQDQCDRDNALDDIEQELLEGEYNPNHYDNFAEAIGEATPDEIETIEDWLERGEFEKLGRMLWCISLAYWEKQAQDKAPEVYYNGRKNDY